MVDTVHGVTVHIHAGKLVVGAKFLEMLIDLDEELNANNIHLVFAELKDPVKDKMVRYGLLETIDVHHFYPTIDTAVAVRIEASR